MVLVLWASHFDEAAATALVTALRTSGLRVKLVGLMHGGARGASGLALVPDVTLDQAIPLAERCVALIIPGAGSAVHRLDNDPRVRELLKRAQANQALFITSAEAAQEVAAWLDDSGAPLTIERYPADLSMIEFAARLAATLQRTAGARKRSTS